jgi:hypothetical protein
VGGLFRLIESEQDSSRQVFQMVLAHWPDPLRRLPPASPPKAPWRVFDASVGGLFHCVGSRKSDFAGVEHFAPAVPAPVDRSSLEPPPVSRAKCEACFVFRAGKSDS